MSPNKILVTGSLGLVGSACVELFKEKGWTVVGIDNNMRHKTLGTKEQDGEYLSVDIRDESAIDALFAKYKFDAIIHAAAQPSHDYSKTHILLDFYINTVGTLNLLEATRIHVPQAVFVHVSTDKVYGENMKREPLEELETRWHHYAPYDEKLGLDMAVHSPFGVSKAAADLYVQEYGYQWGIKTACFRCGCITGKRHQGAELHGFLAYLAKCIKEKKLYRIFGYKGKQVRDQIHARDLANAFLCFIEKPRVAEVYNMGGGAERSVSVLEAISLIEQETGEKAITEYVEEERFGDRQWDIHDVSKFRSHYPEWDYQYSLQDIIKDVCEKV